MKKYLFSFLFSLAFVISYSQCSECANGSVLISGIMDINEQNNSQDYCINSDWTGSITNIADGSTIVICPSSTWTIPSNISISKNVLIENYGTITDADVGLSFFIQGQVQLINKTSGVITVDQFENQDANFDNQGVLAADDIYLHGPSSNSGTIYSTADCGGQATTSCGFFIGNKGQPFNNTGTVNTIDATIQDQIIGGGMFNSTGTLDLSNNSGLTDNIFNVNNINIGASSNVTTGDFSISGILNCNNANITATMCFLTGGAYGTDCSSGTPVITSCSILPVDFISFSAVRSSNRIFFTWEVQSEINVNFYEILESKNGVEFSSIAKISANGERYYQHQKIALMQEGYFYKIKNVDLDGLETEHPNIQHIKAEKTSKFTIYPNPILKNDVLRIKLDTKNSYDELDIYLYDINGKLIIHNYYNDWLQNEINLELNKVNHSGIFTLQIYTRNEIFTEKLFIK